MTWTMRMVLQEKENGYIFGTFFRGKGEGLAGGLEHFE